MHNKFYQHLDTVQLRMGMYTGEISLKSLDCYIGGYMAALRDLDAPTEQPKFRDFHEFVRAKYNYSESTAGWADMILAVVLGYQPENVRWEDVFVSHVTDEQHLQSIEIFSELLAEFKAEFEDAKSLENQAN